MNKLVENYLQRLQYGEMYKDFERNELKLDETVTIDGLAYFLDDTPCSVEDRVEDRDGRYDNSAAFICNKLGEEPDTLVEFTDENNSYGFLALYAQKDKAAIMDTGEFQTARIPIEEVSVFPYEDQEEVDILIEI
jgi:hypothetical protein